jgi:hypothetical protein
VERKECAFKTGYRRRAVECIRESSPVDEEITGERDCTENKPRHRDSCKNTQPCRNDTTDVRFLGRPTRSEKRKTSYKRPEKGSVMKDKATLQPFHTVEVPVQKTKNEIVLSDEVTGALGDQIAQTVDTKGTIYYEGDKAQQKIKEGQREMKKENERNYCEQCN